MNIYKNDPFTGVIFVLTDHNPRATLLRPIYDTLAIISTVKITPSKLKGIYIVEPKAFQDNRGMFVKTFHEKTFRDAGLEYSFTESFYSVSNKNVIRGMHFHNPPEDHAKLVYVTQGSVLDVVLDIRSDSPTYGQFETTVLSSTNHKMVYMAKGFAHGFLSLEDNTCMVYLQTGMYSPEHDSGIEVNSFGFAWPTDEPILSERDLHFQKLKDFNPAQ